MSDNAKPQIPRCTRIRGPEREYAGEPCGNPLRDNQVSCGVCWLMDLASWECHEYWLDNVAHLDERMDVRQEWRGREAEANAWEFLPRSIASDDGSLHFDEMSLEWRGRSERAQRPRAVIEVCDHMGSRRNYGALADARFRLASDNRDHGGPAFGITDAEAADARVGHTSREVEETIARICPPESRGEESGGTYLAHPITAPVAHSILHANPDMISPSTIRYFDTAISADTPLSYGEEYVLADGEDGPRAIITDVAD